jgi:hypothetical protein
MALTLDFSSPNDYTSGFTALRKLQHLQDKILPLPSWLQSLLGTVSELSEAFRNESAYLDSQCRLTCAELESLRQELNGYLVSVESLKSRSQGILKLVGCTFYDLILSTTKNPKTNGFICLAFCDFKSE